MKSARTLTGVRHGVIATISEAGVPQDFVTFGITEDEHRRMTCRGTVGADVSSMARAHRGRGGRLSGRGVGAGRAGAAAPAIGADSSRPLRRPRRDKLIRDKWAGREAAVGGDPLDPRPNQ